MSGTILDGAARRVRLPSVPESVPTARRIVRDTLRSWGEDDLAGDALIVTSELATNATLHSGSAFFVLEVVPAAGGGVVAAVTDAGDVPAAAVVPRPPEVTAAVGELTTGRGLAIIEMLAAAWGVEVTPDGKRVWAALGSVAAASLPAPAAVTPPAGSAEQMALPPGWHLVRLLDCPVELGLRQDDHLDELIRDLQLSPSTTPGNDEGAHLSEQIRAIVAKHAHVRHMGRRIAQSAASAGMTSVTVDLPVSVDAAGDVAELHAAVQAADALARDGRLLLEPSPAEVSEAREWMSGEFVRQIRDGLPPISFAQWRERRGALVPPVP